MSRNYITEGPAINAVIWQGVQGFFQCPTF